MRKIALTFATTLLYSLSSYSQETASSTGDKKIFTGLAGSFYIADQPHIGGRLNVEYFINEKISIEGAYNFGWSRNKISHQYSTLSSSESFVGEKTTFNYIHFFSITPTYYIIGSANSDLSIFAGVGPAYSWIRSSEFGKNYALGTWRGIHINVQAGVDYAVGPGKIYGLIGYAPRIATINTNEDKTYFEYLFQISVGYKIGF